MSKVFKAVGNVVKSVGKAVGNVVSGVVKAVGSVVKGVVSAVGSVVSSVLNFVMTPFLGLFGLGTPSMPDVSTPESIKGVLVQHQGSDSNIPIVYGYRKVGGIVVYAETGSTTNKYLYVSYVLSEGQVEGLREVWLDNVQLPSAIIPGLNNGTLVTVTGNDNTGKPSKFANLVSLQFFRGLQANNPADLNVGNVLKAGIFKDAPSFTNAMNYNGMCTMFARYEWPADSAIENPFGGSIPQLQVCLLGKRVSPLLTGTPENYAWGTFPNYTEVYSSNPAEILLDYLRNPFYGKGLLNSEIDWPSFKRAAAKCNQQVTYITGVTGPILQQHIVINTNDTIFNNCKKILSNFRAYLPYTNGKYKLIIEDAGDDDDILSGVSPIVATFNKDNIQGEITYTGIEKSAKYNAVTVNYCDPDNQWSAQSVTYPPTETERYTYLAQDNFRENTGNFTFEGLINYAMASDMARLIFNKSRWQDTVTLTVSSQGFELEPGDNIYIDANILKFGTDPAQQAVPWRIISCKLNNDYTFSLGCVRNPDFIYPHVRVGEIDFKYAVYIPKGAGRYYPAEPIGVPIGLKPPTYAPTDPNDPSNPPEAPGVGVLIDVISIYETTAVQRTTGIFVVCKFLQPATAAYDAVKIRYKQNLTTVASWTEILVTTKAGANQPITFEIGPLLNNTVYRIEGIVQYIGGAQSTRTYTTAIQLGTPTDGSNGNGTNPTPVVPPANLANNFVSQYFARTELTSSLPQNPRKANFSFTADATYNALLNGYELWYKPSANPKWFRTTGSINANSTAITVPLTFGTRLYPLVPGSGGVPATVDNYDFIFRYTYSDGKTSVWQFRAMNCSVEYGAYGYDVYLFATDQGGTIIPKELTSAYVPQLAGPSDIPETRNLNVSITAISNATSNTLSRIYWALGSPAQADWVNWNGMRLYYHKAGTANAWTQVDSTPVEKDAFSFFVKQDINYDANYEYVLVPLVNYGGTTVEAFQGRYMTGKIHNRTGDADYPSNGNWMSSFKISPLEDIAVAKAHLGEVQVAAPRNDTTIANLSSTTLTTAGVPFSPRRVQISITQRNTGTPNGRVKGLKVYYKLNANLYWKESVYVFPTPYTEGSTITFNSTQTTPAMDLGFPSYPNIPATGSQGYDFVMRWVYDDDTESKFETAFTNQPVERWNGGYDFIFLSGANYLVGNAPYRANVDISRWLEKNAPPGAVTDSRTITDTLTPLNLYAQLNTTNMFVWVSEPAVPMRGYLAGFKLLRREVIPGVASTILTDTSNSPYLTSEIQVNGIYQSVIGAKFAPATWDVEYEWLMVPQVWYNGAIQDANKSIYWKGKIHNRENETAGSNPYPYGYQNFGNWFSKITPTRVDTATALDALNQPFPETGAVPRLQAVNRIGGAETGYHNVQFQVTSTTTSVTIYRRAVQDIKISPYIYYNQYNTYFSGWWEVITLNSSNWTKDANNVITVNLRPAISAKGEFNNYDFNPANPKSTTNNLYRNNTNIAPVVKYLVGSLIGGGVQDITQILLVLTTSAGQSTKGLLVDMRSNGTVTNLLTDAQTVDFTTTPSSTNTIISPVPQPLTGTIHSSNLNTMKKSISEARSPVSASNIKTGAAGTTTYTLPTATPGVL